MQVVKDPMGTKGARADDGAVASPAASWSTPRRATATASPSACDDDERERLRELVKKLQPKDGGGLIVRTAARGAAARRSWSATCACWSSCGTSISASAKQGGAPRLVHQEVDLALEMVRDDLRVDVDEVITDDERHLRAHPRLRRAALAGDGRPRQAAPRRDAAAAPLRGRAARSLDAAPPRRPAVRRLPAVRLRRGVHDHRRQHRPVRRQDAGSRTRSSRTTSRRPREVVRQLRLRDIGGIIVIDFIDMASKKNRDAVIAVPAGRAEEGPLEGLPRRRSRRSAWSR